MTLERESPIFLFSPPPFFSFFQGETMREFRGGDEIGGGRGGSRDGELQPGRVEIDKRNGKEEVETDLRKRSRDPRRG